MATFSIDQLRALPDYQKVTKWDMRFLSLPLAGVLAIPAADSLNLRCETIEIPQKTNEKVEVQIRGHKTYHAGITSYNGTINVTFTETVDNTIKLFFKAWSELVYGTRSGTAFEKKDYEGTLQITMLNSKDRPVYSYILYGVWPEAGDFGSLEGASAEVQKPSITFSYDFFTDAPLRI
jgi:hypothetical protein